MKTAWIGIALMSSLCLSGVAVAETTPPDANAPRTSIAADDTWDTGAAFKNDGAWESAFRNVQARLSSLARDKESLGTSPGLAACLARYFDARLLMDRVSLYSNLKSAEDENVERSAKMRQRAVGLANDFQSKTSFIRQAILKPDDAAMAALLAEAPLAPYRHYIEDLRRRRARILNPEAERVLSLAGENLWAEIDLNELPSDVEMIFKATTRDLQLPMITDEKGNPVQLTLANYSKYRSSKDRRVRRETVESFFAALRKYQDILAAALAAEMRRDVFMARARTYDRAVDAYLDRQDVPVEVMDNLIRTIRANIRPLHRYVELRKKLLDLPDLHLYDLYTPIVPAAAVEVTYDEGVDDILRALAPLGESYVDVLASSVRPGGGWVDIFPNKGKESGAFSSAIWGVHPFVKLNFQNDLDDVSTAAHEFGHAMHSSLNMKAQPYVNFGYSIFTAEIASTFNEMLLSRSLLKKYQGDDRTRLALLGNLLETIRTTIYRQTLFAEFERKVHAYAEAGTPITAELLNKTYADLVRFYYGRGFTMGGNDEIEWAYIPHFYWKYYVFTYATGLSSGIALSEKIAGGDAQARERYLAMLKEPREASPIGILKKAGLDLTRPDAIVAAVRLMDQTITEMERIAARMKR